MSAPVLVAPNAVTCIGCGRSRARDNRSLSRFCGTCVQARRRGTGVDAVDAALRRRFGHVRQGDWAERAACTAAPRDTWPAFGTSEDARRGHAIPITAVAAAREYCARCPVIDECATYAAAVRAFGLWGGQWRSITGAVRDIHTMTGSTS